MKRLLYIFMVLAAASCGINCYAASEVPVRDGDNNCYDMEVVFARGSGGEYEKTREYFELKKASETIFSGFGYTTRFADLDYPATDMSSPLKLLGAYVSAGKAYEFGRSVDAGVDGLKAHYRNISRQCPDTLWILIGYSQGAMVVSEAVKSFKPASVQNVVLFGDPETYLPEGDGLFPDACFDRNFSSWRRYAPECRTYTGVFGGRNPYEAEGLTGKYSLWCESDDYICGSSHNPLRNAGHTRYADYIADDFIVLLAKTLARHNGLTPNPSETYNNAVLSSQNTLANKLVVRWDTSAIKTKYLLLRLNKIDLGYVEASSGMIEIWELDLSEPNNVSLVAMNEDGELGDEVKFDSVIVQYEPEPEIVLSPVEVPGDVIVPEEPAIEQLDESADNERLLQGSLFETKTDGDSVKSSDGDTPTSNIAANPASNLARILPRNGLSIMHAADALKIGLAVLTATAALVIFWIKKK